jgi:hypothetical protein
VEPLTPNKLLSSGAAGCCLSLLRESFIQQEPKSLPWCFENMAYLLLLFIGIYYLRSAVRLMYECGEIRMVSTMLVNNRRFGLGGIFVINTLKAFIKPS